jgi:hypothetical protein
MEIKNEHGKKQKLSECFAGSLSTERVDELQNELTKMREEWNRDIYYCQANEEIS